MQWQVSTGSGFTNLSNSGVYSGVTTDTLTITGVTSGLNGAQYQAVFSNAAGLTATTTPATLTVDYAPAVTSNPSSVTVNAGQSTTFTAAGASGNPAPTVQWQVSTDGGNTFTPITGATSTTLSITNATAAQNGTEYEAVFTNSVGSVTTSAATLTVDYAPTVTNNPTNLTVNAGQTATFMAAASDGNPTTTTVQWQVSTNGGQTFSNIRGRHQHDAQLHRDRRPEWQSVPGGLQQCRQPQCHHQRRHADGQNDCSHDNEPHHFTELIRLRPGGHVHGDGQANVDDRHSHRLRDLHERLDYPGHRDPQQQRKSDADDQGGFLPGRTASPRSTAVIATSLRAPQRP